MLQRGRYYIILWMIVCLMIMLVYPLDTVFIDCLFGCVFVFEIFAPIFLVLPISLYFTGAIRLFVTLLIFKELHISKHGWYLLSSTVIDDVVMSAVLVGYFWALLLVYKIFVNAIARSIELETKVQVQHNKPQKESSPKQWLKNQQEIVQYDACAKWLRMESLFYVLFFSVSIGFVYVELNDQAMFQSIYTLSFYITICQLFSTFRVFCHSSPKWHLNDLYIDGMIIFLFLFHSYAVSGILTVSLLVKLTHRKVKVEKIVNE